MKYLLLISLLTISCSKKESLISREYSESIRPLQKIIENCKEQRDNLLVHSYMDDKKTLMPKFIGDEKNAIINLDNFEVKFSSPVTFKDTSYLVKENKCDQRRLDEWIKISGKSNYCDSTYEEQKFFYTMIIASKTQSWNQETKTILKDSIKKYTELIAKISNLSMSLVAIDLINDMAINHFFDQETITKINKLHKETGLLEKNMTLELRHNKQLISQSSKLTCHSFEIINNAKLLTAIKVRSKLIEAIKLI